MTHTLHNFPARLHPVALALAGLLLSGTTWAATFVVTDAGDAPDVVPGDGLCAHSGAACSLRAAIQEANTLGGAHTIHFAIATGGPGVAALIAPTTPLPAVRTPITIDGYTQPGSSANTAAVGNNAVINVRIDGKNIGVSASGLVFYPGSSNSALRGVAITGFNTHGVFLLGDTGPVGSSTNGVTIAGNFIGTDGSGAGDDTNGLLANGMSGIRIANYAHENIVGGATSADRNLIITSSSGAGISIDGVYNTQIRNNYIGTDRSGSSRRNTLVGVDIAGPYTIISNNVVGALGTGISIHGGGVGLVMQGNLIGVGTTGTSIADAASSHGIYIRSIDTTPLRNNHIGGTNTGEGNTIANWGGNGVHIERSSTTAAQPRYQSILGNSIHSNGGLGIELIDTATGQGTQPGDAAPPTVNGGLRYPVITGVTSNAAGTLVSYGYSGAFNARYRIEVFSNAACDPSSYGEGQTFLGSADIMTGGVMYTGDVLLPAVPAGSHLTMTATRDFNDADGSLETSEFSRCFEVPAGPGDGGPGNGGAVTPVPTLGHWGLVLLSALLGAMGLRARRHSR
ncbi:IPTL-CTERM sorting domain-containing protein [Acidovorax sp. JMULE5]|uniref:IPTL-CTERM sorting domain-containing protein n=1 Tax=Acidovorax sp. JMULE5 TaxID=2518343 RepID=UPI0015A4BA49|nr:IPTL-CTERM sorting domain-containing protein [Acidovorax sp. JMULE5]QLA80928.1 IPTL-CTERM sorting domain-containing protein [Acidovorax sp. JMULE5]